MFALVNMNEVISVLELLDRNENHLNQSYLINRPTYI